MNKLHQTFWTCKENLLSFQLVPLGRRKLRADKGMGLYQGNVWESKVFSLHSLHFLIWTCPELLEHFIQSTKLTPLPSMLVWPDTLCLICLRCAHLWFLTEMISCWCHVTGREQTITSQRIVLFMFNIFCLLSTDVTSQTPATLQHTWISPPTCSFWWERKFHPMSPGVGSASASLVQLENGTHTV